MLAKEVFLKKIINLKNTLILFFTIIVLSPLKSNENNYLIAASEFFNNINEFSSSFLQIQDNEVSEGVILYKKNRNRLRIEYQIPSNIVFVLKNNKAMYFNVELKEVQYFDPKNTIGQFLIDLFNDKSFLLNSKFLKGEGYIKINKEIKFNKELHKIEIYFEKSPFQLRKFRIINNNGTINFSLINLNFNPELDDKIFSLANPLLRLN